MPSKCPFVLRFIGRPALKLETTVEREMRALKLQSDRLLDDPQLQLV